MPSTTDAIATARSVLPAYRACYAEDDRLQRALRASDSSGLDLAHAAMNAAIAAADTFAASAIDNGDETAETMARMEVLFRAADAAETVWLALQPITDADYFEACVDAALNGRPELNISIFDEEKQA